MNQIDLSQFARCGDADFSYLRTQIDQCARTGHTYEFRDCRLLPKCLPPTGTVGFGCDKAGYFIYVSPGVLYSGKNPWAASLFRTGRQGLDSFKALELFLRNLATPDPADPPRRVAPLHQFDELTEPEKISLPQPTKQEPPDHRALARDLGRVVMGQTAAVEAAAFRLYTHISKKNPARPLSLIFYGPTGVGKSELGKQIAPVLNQYFGAEAYQFVWTELNTFTEPHSVYRLIGAPPGYVGYEDKPIFEAVAKNPRTIFMFDELEKAHPEVLKTFMSVLDEGRCAARRELADHTRELDFRSCVLIFTTNAVLSDRTSPRQELRAPHADPQAWDDTAALADRIFRSNESARKTMVSGGCLREIAGRFGGFIEFTPLDVETKIRIIAKQIASLGQEYDLHITYVSPGIVQTIIDRTADEAFSVRSHMSVIEGYLTEFFLKHAEQFGGEEVRLEGTMAHKQLLPAPCPIPASAGAC